MENNENLNNEPEIETAPQTAEMTLPQDIGETGTNLEICPNCLEPNTDNLAVCRYCGMPLHQGADPDLAETVEDEAVLAANRAEAAPEEKKPAKKQESGFRRVMPYLGLYLIYYAITGCFDISRQIKQAAEEGQTVNAPLAYLSQGIWFVAGLMMAWPLIRKGYRKLRHLPDEDAVPEEQPETDNADTAEDIDESPAEIPAPEETPETDADAEAAEDLPDEEQADAADPEEAE